MKALRTLALAAIAAFASLPALADTVNMGTLLIPSSNNIGPMQKAATASFTDTFNFDISASAAGMALAIEMNYIGISGAGVVSLSSMELFKGATSQGTFSAVSGRLQGSFATMTAGTYSLVIKGSATAGTPNGSYAGNLTLTSVPEPGTLALFGFGLAAAGFASRRGRKTSV